MFVEQLIVHNRTAESITEIAMDISQPYKKSATEHLPGAEKLVDRFYMMRLAGEAFEKVRKEVARESGGLGRAGM